MAATKFSNPFRPGAGHPPPYLAGRATEEREFKRLLEQETILENLVLTGLRGVGKTVLVESLKPLAQSSGWLWAGTDLSESTSISETNLALRLLTDIALVTSSVPVGVTERQGIGFGATGSTDTVSLDFSTLRTVFDATPGLTIDKLKAVFDLVAPAIARISKRGIVFAYDEAQNLADHAAQNQFPLSLLLDLFQSLQRKNFPFMLVLAGLPTLFPKLVEARTYAERMFRVLFLNRLEEQDVKDAILKPIQKTNCPVRFSETAVGTIVRLTGGYPYFIQFVCKEVYDVWVSQSPTGEYSAVPVAEITNKLDTDFFSGRWARTTERQRDLLSVIARLPNSDEEFTVQEVVAESKAALKRPFSASHVSQMLVQLIDAGLIYKGRYGRYLFAVPLMAGFIRRQMT